MNINAEDRDINQMDTNTQPELLPCPFCGGTATAYEDQGGWWEIVCDTCRARTSLQTSEADAIAAWNTRAGLAARSPRDEKAVEDAIAFIEAEMGEHFRIDCGGCEGCGYEGDGSCISDYMRKMNTSLQVLINASKSVKERS